MYVSTAKAKQYYGCSDVSLRRWADQGIIKHKRTPGGTRIYWIEEDKNTKETQKTRERIIYCRVSSRKQASDLERQVAFVSQQYPEHKIITDIGSGLNFKRPGFLSLLGMFYCRKYTFFKCLSKTSDFPSHVYKDESLKNAYRRLWLPQRTECVDLSSISLNTSATNPNVKSWFSIYPINHRPKNCQKTYSQSCKCLVADGMAVESTKSVKKRKVQEQKKEHNYLKATKIRIYPTAEQKRILKQIAGVHRQVYNIAIAELNSKDPDAVKNKLKLRNKHVNNSSETVTQYPYMATVPNHIRTAAIFEAHKAYDTNMKMYKITQQPFKLCFKTKKTISFSFPVEDTSLKRSSFSSSSSKLMKSIGTLKVSKKQEHKLKDKYHYEPRIVRDDCYRYWIVITDGQTLENQESYDKDCVIAAIDPGIKRRHTVYFSNQKAAYVGKSNKELIRLLRLRKEAEQLRAKGRKEQGYNHQQRRKFKKRAARKTAKLNDLRREMDYKFIQYLCTTAQIILLPYFDVSDMKRKGKLRKRDRIRFEALGHYQFKQRLLTKAKEYGVTVLLVSEHYTSKTCGNCGKRGSFTKDRYFKCTNCNLCLDRDLNGARNILLRAIRGWFMDQS